MKSILILLLTFASCPAAVVYDGIRTGYSGIRDFHDSDDSAGIYLSLAAAGYEITGAEVMRVWNAAPFTTWPTGDPVIRIFGTTLGSNLGNGVEAPNYLNLLGTLSFSAITEVRGTTAATQEIVSLSTAAPIHLAANRNYWVVVGMADGNGMSILSSPGSGPLAQNITGTSTDAARTLNVASGGLSLRLNATIVPEPSAFLLGLFSCAVFLRRSR